MVRTVVELLTASLWAAVPEEIGTLITLHGGALFALTMSLVELLDRSSVRALVEAMVRGALVPR
ncbi:hypothetical protein NE857_16510 [Nocardiopsis exhalans]|uniref:Uncharacterized protein n=1 Tax=Nocardiopsis exhalans TaxID=163604 RepID=A0ABY5DJ16_9ACTN|nr:hypothetical protein [Nocardiopsis exhalans]USY23075.1 hypothetical protein NE857_16510 [Nocardiopsis exhalans]